MPDKEIFRKMQIIKTYSELKQLQTFEERYEYCKLGGIVGETTFGFDRYLNQQFYRSPEWKRIRREIILRDEGCDLAFPGYEIHSRIYIHHLNPISEDELLHGVEAIINPNNLVCVSFDTHQAIHYGDSSLLPKTPIERRPNDTKLW